MISLNKNTKGSSSLIFKLNDLPKGGSCSINPKNGTAFKTFFTLFCTNWYDTDGVIKIYEYYGFKNLFYLFLIFIYLYFFASIWFKAYNKDDTSPVLINFDSLGNTIQQMKSGPDNDFNKMYLFVNVIDDFGGYTTFNIMDPISVVSDVQYLNSLISQINDSNKSSVFIQETSTGIKFSNNIIAIGDALNQNMLYSNDTNVIFLKAQRIAIILAKIWLRLRLIFRLFFHSPIVQIKEILKRLFLYVTRYKFKNILNWLIDI